MKARKPDGKNVPQEPLDIKDRLGRGKEKTRRQVSGRAGEVVSWKASAYIKELIVCPNGERVSRSEKLIALVLAESHQMHGEGTFPSLQSMAVDALMDERSARRLLGSLERKGVIVRRRAERQGRGQMTFYFFPALEAVQDPKNQQKTGSKPSSKGGQFAPLFFDERGTEGGQKGDKSRIPYKEEQEQEQKLKAPPLPPTGGTGPKNCIPIRLSDTTAPVACSDAAVETSVDYAVARVYRECGFVAARLRRRLHAVAEQRVEQGEAPEEVADRMIDAWRRYGKQGTRLYRRRSPAEFYEAGLWLNSNLWDWDNAEIRQERLNMEARAGSFG